MTEDFEKLFKISQHCIDYYASIKGKDLDVVIKEDSSPVTKYDLLLSEFILKELLKYFPLDIHVSEESDRLDLPDLSDRIWYVDPIDGTKEFIKKNGEWAIHIGMATNFSPQIGVVIRPDDDLIFIAEKDKGCFKFENKTLSPLRRKDETKELTESVLVESRSHFDEKNREISDLLNFKDIKKHGSVGLKLVGISKSKFDFYFNHSKHCKYWDFCAPQIILEEAGGAVLDFKGNPIVYDKNSFLLNQSIFCGASLASTRLVISKIKEAGLDFD